MQLAQAEALRAALARDAQRRVHQRLLHRADQRLAGDQHAAVVEKRHRDQTTAEDAALDVDERQDSERLAIVLDREIDARVAVRAGHDAPPGRQVGDGGGGVLLDEAIPGFSDGLFADKGQHAVSKVQGSYHARRVAGTR